MIPISGPSVTEREIRYVADAAANAWYENANLYNERFEQAFAAYIGRRFAVSLPSCTSALHLVLAALGIGPGDEVVVPDITWIATAAPIHYVGAAPVFVDIDERSWCLDSTALEDCITERTRAVIVVDLYGGMADMTALESICERHGIMLIEDAAEAVGSRFRGRPAGGFGLAGCFSFHGSKTLTTGEGGMLLTDDGRLLERIQVLRDHGRTPGDRMFFNGEVAFKYKMSSLQAAFGLAQVERVEELVAHKRAVFGWYAEELAELEGVTLNSEPPGVFNSYWMVTVLVDPGFGLTKERIIAALGQRGIDSRPFFHPLSCLPAYQLSKQAEAARARNRTAYRISPYGVNLPSGMNMDREKVSRVCGALREILGSR